MGWPGRRLAVEAASFVGALVEEEEPANEKPPVAGGFGSVKDGVVLVLEAVDIFGEAVANTCVEAAGRENSGVLVNDLAVAEDAGIADEDAVVDATKLVVSVLLLPFRFSSVLFLKLSYLLCIAFKTCDKLQNGSFLISFSSDSTNCDLSDRFNPLRAQK